MKKVTTQQQILRFLVFVILLIVGVSLFVFPSEIAVAQQPTPSDDEVNTIARKLYCPVCENIPLDVCPTQACEQWREEIRLRLALGWSEDDILQYFVDQYGARVLAEPPRAGLNWLVYIIPPVAFLAGIYILFRAIRSWQALTKQPVGGETPNKPAQEENEYVSRLEEELRRRG